ncbi:Methyltransferase-like 26 [Collichthys lucidus]|uniref:Methyltransferase-like 26 n=1 Tax=Collichthys lucidus TaxID=240159 RepID=A0A4U5U5L4_COLLU|nr:Methyltransferase-like 26 [Collichthys lucidus]
MLNAAAAERNKEPILAVLRESVNTGRPLQALEISSGTGQHVTHFAQGLRNVIWQPSEYDRQSLASIEAYRAHYQLHNVKPAIHLDASQPPQCWGGIQPESLDLVVNINMIHISSFACTEGLFKGAGTVLKPQGLLLTYGELRMGTQGYLPPQFYRTEKWFIPGEVDRHASKQQVSSVQEGEFGVKHPVVPEQDGQTP